VCSKVAEATGRRRLCAPTAWWHRVAEAARDRDISVKKPTVNDRIGYTGCMSTFLRAVTALSAAVTAVCAVVLTLHLTLADSSVRVEQLRTFDAVSLSRTVFNALAERRTGLGLTMNSDNPPCPATVAIKEGVRFTCTFTIHDGTKMTVPAIVKDTYSGELEVGTPTP
jgi:hypothetical protein